MSARSIDTGTSELRLEIDDRVAVLTLDRPEARNALSMDLKRALNDWLPRLADDPDVGCVLLTGAGSAFCSGGDTRAMAAEGKPASYEDRVKQLRWEHAVPLTLYRMGTPSIAALPGPAAGAGLSLALACDLRVMAESAFVTTAYARVGLPGDYGGSWFLTRLVGTARARELFFTARRVPAQECAEVGLVNRVVPDAELAKQALELAKEVASGPPLALALMKDNLNRALVHDLEVCLDVEAERMVRGAQTEDYVEAVTALREKRTPTFRGR